LIILSNERGNEPNKKTLLEYPKHWEGDVKQGWQGEIIGQA
jgi:hypothetical protein